MSQSTPHPDDGRVAVVTGGTRGIGAAVTRRLTAAGVRVVAAYSDDKSTAAALETELHVRTARVDIADPVACASLVADVITRYGRIDHLVNNAGLLVEAPST